jgi:hypothetical protein
MISKRKFKWWFNFAASPAGGGLKRLLETAYWFNQHDGALFFVNAKLGHLPIWQQLDNNQYIFADPSPFQKLLLNAPYLRRVIETYGTPHTYFAYGQPLPQRIGQRNWLHISNALTLCRAVKLDLPTRVKNLILGQQIIQSAPYVDIYSGESEFTLNLLRKSALISGKQIFLATNGLDNTLISAYSKIGSSTRRDAITVGTYSYKNLQATLHLFLDIKKNDVSLTKLHVVGPTDLVPKSVKNHPDVVCHGHQNHNELIERLTNTKVYISSSQIENSSNAALEGLMLCDLTYLSDIPSHRELLSRKVPFTAYKSNHSHDGKYLCAARPTTVTGIFPQWNEVIALIVNF